MNKKLLLEFIPLSIFALSVLTIFFRIPYMGAVTAISGMAVAMLYFYAAFWLFSETGLPKALSITSGLIYSIVIIACLFCRQKWPYGNIYAIIGYIGLGPIAVLCLINLKKPGYRGQLYRCAAFLVMLSVAYFYSRNLV